MTTDLEAHFDYLSNLLRTEAELDGPRRIYSANTSKTGQLGEYGHVGFSPASRHVALTIFCYAVSARPDESLISAQQPPFRIDSISLDHTEDEDQIMQGRDQGVSRTDQLGHAGDASYLTDDPAKDFKAEWEVSLAVK